MPNPEMQRRKEKQNQTVSKRNKFLYEKNKIIKNTLTNAFYLMRILCFAAQAHFILYICVAVDVSGPIFMCALMMERAIDEEAETIFMQN